ncbi:MAG: thiopurine S-methyltransferase [Pseudomonadota bacterium]
MEASFWHERWQRKKIAFHEGVPNALLVAGFARLGLSAGARVFVPLCGKSADLGWLLARGHRVVGIELNEGAVAEAFEGLGLTPEITTLECLTHYRGGEIEIYAGDVFALNSALLGPVEAIYDRAALVALPETMRAAYARHLVEVTAKAPQFLITYDYEQSQTAGPPFSVPEATVAALYDDHYRREHLASSEIAGPLAERCSGSEIAWWLRPR